MPFPGQFQGTASFAESTTFDEFFDSTQKNTTSNGWVTYDTFQTPEEKEAGLYYLGWSLAIGQSDKEKRVGIRIRYRPVGSGFTNASDFRETVGFDGTFTLHSGFKIVEISTDAFVDLRVQWGQTDDGGTGLIKDVNLIFYRVGDLP